MQTIKPEIYKFTCVDAILTKFISSTDSSKINQKPGKDFSGFVKFIPVSPYCTKLSKSNPSEHDPFVSTDPLNAKLKKLHEDSKTHTKQFTSGLIHFKNVELHGPAGLLINRKKKEIYYGHTLGCPINAAIQIISRSPEFDHQVDSSSVALRMKEPSIIYNKCISMKARGENVFGHWLLDYIPRLFIVALSNSSRRCPVLFTKIPKWATLLTKIHNSLTIKEDKSRLIKTNDCYVPIFTKIGFGFMKPISKISWTNLKDFFDVSNQSFRSEITKENLSEKIFVSRPTPGPNDDRKISNITEIEELAIEKGFQVVQPEHYSLFAQSRIFEKAKIIIGIDGSALHSIIYCKSPALLIVLMGKKRANLWHAGVCEIMGHSIHYIQSEKKEDSYHINSAEFKKILIKTDTFVLKRQHKTI